MGQWVLHPPTSPSGNTPPMLAARQGRAGGLPGACSHWPAVTGDSSVPLAQSSLCPPCFSPWVPSPLVAACCHRQVHAHPGHSLWQSTDTGIPRDKSRQEPCPYGVTLESLPGVPVPGGTSVKLSWCSGRHCPCCGVEPGGDSDSGSGSSDDAACSHSALQQPCQHLALPGKPVPRALALPGS